MRLREACCINKSLSALGNVISALSAAPNRHVPYRDSKLTLLLRDALGGDSRTAVIATVSPIERCFSETLSTLHFAQRAKLVHNYVAPAQSVIVPPTPPRAGDIPNRHAQRSLAAALEGVPTAVGGAGGATSLAAAAAERYRQLVVADAPSILDAPVNYSPLHLPNESHMLQPEIVHPLPAPSLPPPAPPTPQPQPLASVETDVSDASQETEMHANELAAQDEVRSTVSRALQAAALKDATRLARESAASHALEEIAEAAQREAEAAKREAEAVQREAEAAQREAEAAQRETEAVAASREAERREKEAALQLNQVRQLLAERSSELENTQNAKQQAATAAKEEAAALKVQWDRRCAELEMEISEHVKIRTHLEAELDEAAEAHAEEMLQLAAAASPARTAAAPVRVEERSTSPDAPVAAVAVATKDAAAQCASDDDAKKRWHLRLERMEEVMANSARAQEAAVRATDEAAKAREEAEAKMHAVTTQLESTVAAHAQVEAELSARMAELELAAAASASEAQKLREAAAEQSMTRDAAIATARMAEERETSLERREGEAAVREAQIEVRDAEMSARETQLAAREMLQADREDEMKQQSESPQMDAAATTALQEELKALRAEKESLQRTAGHALEAAQRAAAMRDEEAERDRLTADRDRAALLLELNDCRRRLASCEEQLTASRAPLTPAPARLVERSGAPVTLASTAMSSGGGLRRSRQSARVIARVIELGLADTPVSEIDAALCREGHATSTGTPWPSKNDGRVVTRLLLRNGLQPNFAADQRLAEYARQYTVRMAASAAAVGPSVDLAIEYDDAVQSRPSSQPLAAMPLAHSSALQPLSCRSSGRASAPVPDRHSLAGRKERRSSLSSAVEADQEQVPPTNGNAAEAQDSIRSSECDDSSRLSEWEWEQKEEAAVRARTEAWRRRQQRASAADGETCGIPESEDEDSGASSSDSGDEAWRSADEAMPAAKPAKRRAWCSMSSQGSLSQPGGFLGNSETAEKDPPTVSQPTVVLVDVGSECDSLRSEDQILSQESEIPEERRPLSRLVRGESASMPASPRRMTRTQRRARGMPVDMMSGVANNGYRHPLERKPQARDAPWCSLAEARKTVGRRVRLYWGGDRRWYAGRVVLVHPTTLQVFIKYDDHDERWHAMWEEQYEWLEVEEATAGRPPSRMGQKRIGARPRSAAACF